ncbi:DUF952 domain-containing protein [Rhodococcus sp. HNM0569]|uniref:DUF952 domain-containing protein n=1 Tax=Rhodococcus sp. HNM0569 TaxID=2716340 RepID=UPI00146D8C07|nr:DUF952 domain-containing protein [Rhodococcus sp. HNM0569]NLU81382.1 DUF952 domain-containing protein [Rhodococcus sp. HNM0569]
MTEGLELVHLCSRAEWERSRAEGERRPDGFDPHGAAADRFVHLSTPEQVHLPANRLFGGRTDMVMLRLDAARLGAPVRFEPGVPADPDGMRFPHLYGPIPVDAVFAVDPYLPGDDGTFPPLR